MDGGGGHTTLGFCLMSLNYTPKNGPSGKFYWLYYQKNALVGVLDKKVEKTQRVIGRQRAL